jgi:hypothetical protein
VEVLPPLVRRGTRIGPKAGTFFVCGAVLSRGLCCLFHFSLACSLRWLTRSPGSCIQAPAENGAARGSADIDACARAIHRPSATVLHRCDTSRCGCFVRQHGWKGCAGLYAEVRPGSWGWMCIFPLLCGHCSSRPCCFHPVAFRSRTRVRCSVRHSAFCDASLFLSFGPFCFHVRSFPRYQELLKKIEYHSEYIGLHHSLSGQRPSPVSPRVSAWERKATLALSVLTCLQGTRQTERTGTGLLAGYFCQVAASMADMVPLNFIARSSAALWAASSIASSRGSSVTGP